MRAPAFIALGLGFILMGVGLFALTLRKPKDAPVHPTKTQLREQAALAMETKKMRIAAGVVVILGTAFCVMAFS